MIVVVGALIIGITLGLLGSGGSILTVPVLIYLLGHDQKVAVTESLAIVGGLAAFGVFTYARQRLVDYRSVIFFGLPGIAGTTLGAGLGSRLSGHTQLILFAVVMLSAAILMLRAPRGQEAAVEENWDHGPSPASASRSIPWKLVLHGLAVGILTALVGVGGGFLVIPALVLGSGLPMRRAVGTSLAVVAMNSLGGLTRYLSLGAEVDWSTVLMFLLLGTAGTILGGRLSDLISQNTLRRGFGALLVGLAIMVLVREVPAHTCHMPDPGTADQSRSAAVSTAPAASVDR